MGKSTINETKQRAYKSVCARRGRKANDQQAKAAKKIARDGNFMKFASTMKYPIFIAL